MTKNVFLVAIIILFAIGMWPIAIPATIIYLTLAIINKTKRKLTTEELKKENEALRQELADQAVRRAMDKAEGREKKD